MINLEKNMKNITFIIAFSVISLFFTACSKEKMPEVNSENCKSEVLLQIKDKDVRDEFHSLCIIHNDAEFRKGSFKPSSGQTW